MSDEIKMETKEPIRINTGLTTPIVKTGQVTNAPDDRIKIVTLGMEKHLTDVKPKKPNLIEIDSIQLATLISKCVEDLKTPRLLKVNNVPQNVEFVSKFDERLSSIFFNYNINDINKMLGFNEENLADFFSSFFYTNLNLYTKELYNAIPSLLPLMTIETLSDKGIRIIYH